jgi:hypothetical protein
MWRRVAEGAGAGARPGGGGGGGAVRSPPQCLNAMRPAAACTRAPGRRIPLPAAAPPQRPLIIVSPSATIESPPGGVCRLHEREAPRGARRPAGAAPAGARCGGTARVQGWAAWGAVGWWGSIGQQPGAWERGEPEGCYKKTGRGAESPRAALRRGASNAARRARGGAPCGARARAAPTRRGLAAQAEGGDLSQVWLETIRKKHRWGKASIAGGLARRQACGRVGRPPARGGVLRPPAVRWRPRRARRAQPGDGAGGLEGRRARESSHKPGSLRSCGHGGRRQTPGPVACPRPPLAPRRPGPSPPARAPRLRPAPPRARRSPAARHSAARAWSRWRSTRCLRTPRT